MPFTGTRRRRDGAETTARLLRFARRSAPPEFYAQGLYALWQRLFKRYRPEKRYMRRPDA